jgi:small subunit ribosomal protein S20
MPNSPSAKKRLRQSLVRRDRNRAAKSAVRTAIKRVRLAIQDNKVALAETEFRQAARVLDRAGSARVIHRNAAARLKSRIQAAIKRLKHAAGV